MVEHFNYLTPVISGVTQADDWQKIVAVLILGAAFILLGKRLSSRLHDSKSLRDAVVPPEKINLFSFFDFFIEAFLKYHDSIVGKENRKYCSFTASIFLLLLSANLLSLVPGVPAVTTSVWVTVGIALVVFFYFNLLGVRNMGVGGYLAHFCGPIASYKEKGFSVIKLFLLLLALFMFPLEIFSTTLRILTLNLRIYWNMTADHTVLSIFTAMPGCIWQAALYLLGTFVSFMQAFIFTTLSMVYILLAVQHEEEH